MRFIGIGLAAALVLAVAAPATIVSAAKPKPGADAVDPKSRQKGMADAPALVQAAGLGCTVSDARFIGADSKSAQAFYEVACSPGLGGVLVTKKDDPKPAFFPCLETAKPGADGKPGSLACKLPANADPVQALAPFVAKAGTPCQLERARSIGASARNTFFEVACAGGTGYILVASAPPAVDQDVKMNTCLAYEPGGNLFCTLTDRAAQLAVVDRLAADAGKGCVVKDKRYILATVTGSTYFEVACQDGKGYVLEQAANGSLARAVDCANAPGGAECTLTDARQAQTEQAGLYTRLASKAGFNCQVSKYALFPSRNAREEVVELQCSNRPDGGVAVFPATGNGVVFNCAVAEAQGYRCSFSERSAAFAQVTADLKKVKDTTCQVSDSRAMERGTETTVYVETACSDGLPGWVIGYARGASTPTEILSCPQAKDLGGCKLATNKRG